MNKILVGLIVGAVLGVIDGASAWFTPEVRSQMLGIIIGSTLKGMIAGIAAGWFARRVQSVPKGIAFGFAVGLLLAFLVAAMPDPSGNHYWWQIMLPGSVLGGVIGWATQRYGRPASGRGAVTATAIVVLALFGLSANADEKHHHDATPSSAAFEKLKALAGTWQAATMKPDGEKTAVEFRVSAGGSVVQETMFAGTDHEMINMYTVDPKGLTLTHYCSGDNQPRMVLNPAKSTDSQLVFDFVSVGGNQTKSYINGVTIRFDESGKAVEEWSMSDEGSHMKLYLQSRK